MKRLVPILAALLATAGCGGSSEPVEIDQAVVTLPAVPGRPGAAYFTIRANRAPLRLEGVTSASAQRIELHRTSNEGGVMRMAPLQPSEAGIAPGRPLVFEPGGNHAMLFGLDPALQAGGRISLTFRFDSAPPVTVKAEVRGPGQGHAAH